MSFRKLKQDEIDLLQAKGCSCNNWHLINVKSEFSPKNIENVKFSGEIFLGNYSKTFELFPTLESNFGLYNCVIHNCTISDNVFIKDVKLLMNYNIKEGAVIYNTDHIGVMDESFFGNGVEIEVLNEGGGRELKIFDQLSSQIAYMLVSYHHSEEFIKNFNAIIDKYVESNKSDKGIIGEQVRIQNCKHIQNVNIAAHSQLHSVSRLENGTLASTEEAPVKIGDGVFAKNFIIQSGSVVDSSAILTNCFVGQGVQIGKQFSAENSAFFANCEGFHGEACSIFAGPYTVTHHKSTLLIAGLFSFYNAGSGTNQSNHMYKLGPVHQGIMERGAKTGSFSYLLWPSRIGAFSVVVGKHYANFDTSLLPFSYIVESGGKSVISPAMNLFTVGTRRDSQKWAKRDKRKDSQLFDLIHFDLFNPYTVGKIYKGMQVLLSLYEKADRKQDYVIYNGINIKRLMLKTCRNYYDMAIKIFLGNVVNRFLSTNNQKSSINDLISKVQSSKPDFEDWVDASGMLLPKNEIEKFVNHIENKELETIDEIRNYLLNLFNNYEEKAFIWTLGLIEKLYQIKISEFSPEHLVKIITDWKANSIKLNNMIANDAAKEFDSKSKIGFGIDGDEETKDLDFESVRGSVEQNSFVKDLNAESEQINQFADKLLSELKLGN